MLENRMKKNILGRAVVQTGVVDLQKRGLPHAHILHIVPDEDKPRTPSHPDGVVSAEVPDPIASLELHEIVDTHMVHGPCGPLDPNCACMKDGLCTKNYPKQTLAARFVAAIYCEKTVPSG